MIEAILCIGAVALVLILGLIWPDWPDKKKKTVGPPRWESGSSRGHGNVSQLEQSYYDEHRNKYGKKWYEVPDLDTKEGIEEKG